MARSIVTHPTADLMRKAQAVRGRSLLADARRRLFRNKAAVVRMYLLVIARPSRFYGIEILGYSGPGTGALIWVKCRIGAPVRR